MRRSLNEKRFRLLATLGAVLVSQLVGAPAQALTCPYPARSVERMLAVDEYRSADRFVAYGVMIPSEPVPEFDPDIQTRPAFEARFEGLLARPSGFDTRAAFPVSVTSSCIYHDACGSVPSGPEPAMMVIRTQDSQFVFHASVCNDNLLPNPTDEELTRAIACLDGMSCAPP